MLTRNELFEIGADGYPRVLKSFVNSGLVTSNQKVKRSKSNFAALMSA